MKSILYLAVFVLCQTLSQVAYSQAWEATAEWKGMETELEYDRWFVKNVGTDFYSKKTGLLKGEVSVDCGRAAYVARAVFAYETKRRFLALGRDGRWIDSSEKIQYSGTPEEKLRTFLRNKVVSNTNVESMKDNTFPIQISRSTLTAGTVYNFQMPGFENNEAGRHAYIVKEITPGGYIKFVWATVPAAPRPLSERTLYPLYMPTHVTINNQWGYRRFYQPEDYAAGVLELKRKIPLSANLETPAAVEAETALSALLKNRGYNSSHQNNLAREVFLDYESEKESRRVVPFYKPTKNLTAKFEAQQVASAQMAQVVETPSNYPKTQHYVSAPGFRPYGLIDMLKDRQNDYLDKLAGRGQPSIIDQMLADARRASEEEAERKKPKIVVARNIHFPPPKQNGTFVSDPDVVVEGVSIIGIYHGKLITLLANNEETLEQSLQRQYFNLCSYLEARVGAVEEGYQYFFINKKIVSASNVFNRCPTEDEMYNYTTPERDAEFKDYVLNLKGFYLANRDVIKATLPDWFLTMEYSMAEPMHPHYTNTMVSTAYARLQKALNATKPYLSTPNGPKNSCEVMIDLRGGRQEPMSIRRFIPIITKYYTFLNQKKQSVNVPLVSVIPSAGMERRWGLHGLTQEHYDVEYNINIECGANKTEAATESADAK